MKKINWIKLIGAILFCQAAGLIGSIFTVQGVNTWYLTLNKPSFNPPSWVFGPVWTTLFLFMGISLYIVWNRSKNQESRKIAIIFFIIQWVLNILWSLFFFALQNPFLALIEIIILWIFILLTIIYFYKISKWSAYLLIPYILWVSFAAFLNYNLFILN